MKRISKYLILVLLTLTFMVGKINVNALAVNDTVTFHQWPKDSDNSISADYGYASDVNDYRTFLYKNGKSVYSKGVSVHYAAYDYYAVTNDNRQMKLYCVDPQSYRNDFYKRGVKVTKSYNLNDSKISLNMRALYYGLYTILQSGPMGHASSSSPSESEKKQLVITDMAVKAYFYAGLNGAKSNLDSIGQALYRLGSEVFASNKTKAAQLGVSTSVYNTSYYLMQYGGSHNEVNKAKELIQKGIDAAYEFKQNGGLSGETKVNVSSSTINAETNGRYKTEKVINFYVSELGKNGFINVNASDIVCNHCSENGISIADISYLDNGEWKTLTGTVNLANYLDENKNAKIKITLNKVETENEDCNVTISVKYTVPSPVNIDIFLLDGEYSKTAKRTYQRYIGVVKNGSFLTNDASGGTQENTYTIPSDGIGCVMPKCDSELATPICDAEDNGYVKAPTDIKRCIINNYDDADNSYELSPNNNGVSNAYCSTFCKEDYRTINLNKQISDLKCGGYFQLRARIEGSQDCYRGTITGDKSINKDRFESDIVEAQRNLVNEYNKYLKATDAQNRSITTSGEYKEIVASITGKAIDKINDDGTITVKDITMDYVYSYKTEEELKQAIENDLESAKKNLDQKNYDNSTAYGRYLSIINNLNACTVTWNNSYKFEQKISWEYNEYINGKLQETYYGLVADKDRYLSPVESTLTTNTSIQACTGTIDNEYNLCNGSADNWQSTDAVFSNYDFTICSTDGCTTNTQSVSNAKYVKQHTEKAQDYITPSVFYQIAGSGPASGGITTNNTYTGPNIQLTPVEGLPLSLDSVGGGVFKLNIQDLGEFYDTGELGRLIDFGGANEEHSVAKTQNKTDVSKWDGSYKCYYENNCRVPECPTCDFYCEGDYCEWRECPSCTIECVNCIYNFGELQLNFKPVSTSKFDSANREYGYNWNISTNVGSLSLLEEKAKETITEIEEANTTIYDDESDDSKLEFSIKLTPDVTNYIRDYNKNIEKEEKGGYNDPSLTCYDYEDENNAVYKNVFCYSSFIDGLIEKTDAEIYAKNRGEISNRNSETVLNSGYWKPWTGYEQKENVVGGPSWK